MISCSKGAHSRKWEDENEINTYLKNSGFTIFIMIKVKHEKQVHENKNDSPEIISFHCVKQSERSVSSSYMEPLS